METFSLNVIRNYDDLNMYFSGVLLRFTTREQCRINLNYLRASVHLIVIKNKVKNVGVKI